MAMPYPFPHTSPNSSLPPRHLSEVINFVILVTVVSHCSKLIESKKKTLDVKPFWSEAQRKLGLATGGEWVWVCQGSSFGELSLTGES